MTSNLIPTSGPAVVPVRVPWADFVSDIFSPPLLWAAISPIVSFRDTPSFGQGVISTVLCILFVCLLPTLYIYWLYRRGIVSDLYLPFPQERIRPFLFSIASTFAGYLLVRALNLTPLISAFLLATWFQLILLLFITFFWKISTHTLAISALSILFGLWFGLGVGLLFVPMVALVAAARLRLHRHTLSEVIGGIVLGTVMVILFAHFFPLVN